MLKKLFPAVALLTSLTSYSKNPVDTSFNHRGETFYVIVPSYQFSSTIGLNAILKQQGAPTVSRSTLMAGLGFEDRWKWFALGLDFVYGFQEHSNKKYNLSSPIIVSNIWVKYYVIKNKRMGGIYPFGGISALSQSIFLTDKNATGDINQLFSNSGSVNMTLNTGFAQFGIGADAVDFTNSEGGYLNIKMGYRVNIGSTLDNQWYINETASIKGSPTESLNAFFVQLTAGYTLNRKSNKQLRTY